MAAEIEDSYWDELPAPLQAAAAKLGFNQQLWDNDQESAACDNNWSELTSEQQMAARMLGYTPTTWDHEERSVDSIPAPDGSRPQENGHGVDPRENEHEDDPPDNQHEDWVDSPEQSLENRINALKNEIIHRQKKLKRILGKKEGTAYARMIQTHEDCVNSHLQRVLKDSHPDSSHPNQFPSLNQNPLQMIGNAFLNEYYHALPGCVAITLNCLLYSTLTELASKVILAACHHITTYFTGWHIIDNNFDDSFEEHLFFFMTILFAFSLLRITGALYEWDENRAFQRKKHFHFRNRWHLGYWDMRIMNWFSGGVLRDMFNVDTSTTIGPNNTIEKKWGPRLKSILNIIGFFLLFGCVDYLVEEFGSKIVLNQKETILEGLPSRQLHQQWSSKMKQEQGKEYCISSGGDNDTEECMADLDMDFISDVWNWVKNADRCGWVLDDAQDEDDSACDDCSTNQDNESGILSIHGDRAAKQFKPWKQSDEEWIRMLNIRDDEYLRSTISTESYFSLVGDPDAHFIDPLKELVYYAVITGFSFVCLYWFEIPFQLI